MENRKLIVIVGPTASGKTVLAIELAKRLGTEIVSADSRQIFREMNIGTAKPSFYEMNEVPHHFIGSHSIFDQYDAAQYAKDALACIHELISKNGCVLLCGGSGLYVKAVCEGLDDIPDIPEKMREELIANYNNFGLEWLQDRMKELDPGYYEAIDAQNPQRLIRALEVKIATGLSIREFHKKNKLQHPFKIIKVGLDPGREELYRRIDLRMDVMISEGLFEEAKSLYPYKHLNALQTVGYKEIFDHLDGLYDWGETVRLLKRNSRRYAKRQLTWFRRDQEIEWFQPQDTEKILQWIKTQ